MREYYAKDALKVRVNREMYWMWDNQARDILNVRKFCKRCTECKKNFVGDVLNKRKLC